MTIGTGCKPHQAWRIYHGGPMNKTELTTSPTKVKKAREDGLKVVELVEKSDNPYSLQSEIGMGYYK